MVSLSNTRFKLLNTCLVQSIWFNEKGKRNGFLLDFKFSFYANIFFHSQKKCIYPLERIKSTFNKQVYLAYNLENDRQKSN